MPYKSKNQRNKAEKERQNRYKALGLCISCGKPRNNNSISRCDACIDKSRLAQQKIRGQGRCQVCGNKAISGTRCDKCKEQRVKTNKEILSYRESQGLCTSCGKSKSLPGLKSCISCLERAKNKNNKLKIETFSHYGGNRCACCGETHIEFLQLDHINGGGARDRKLGLVGISLYTKLRKLGYPIGFRVLCANCNFAIGLYGYCPHQKTMIDQSKDDTQMANT